MIKREFLAEFFFMQNKLIQTSTQKKRGHKCNAIPLHGHVHDIPLTYAFKKETSNTVTMATFQWGHFTILPLSIYCLLSQLFFPPSQKQLNSPSLLLQDPTILFFSLPHHAGHQRDHRTQLFSPFRHIPLPGSLHHDP